MKKLIPIMLLFGLMACNQKTEMPIAQMEAPAKTESKTTDTALPGTSLYNLTSTWTSQNSEEKQLKDFRGKVVVMAMIFTSCKTACPRLIADIKHIENKIPKEDVGQVEFVLVSIDPETDTPEHLKEFTQKNNLENWVFLTGSEDNTRELANTLAVKYKEISPMNFSHSNIISVLDENGVLAHQKEGLDFDYEGTIAAVKQEVGN